MEYFRLPSDARSGPNCGVTALAVAAGVSFTRAWNIFATVGKYGKRWKGATYTIHQGPALDKLGIKWRDTVPAGGGSNFAGKHRTIKYFTENHTKPNTLYMITTGSHVQCVMNGMVIDQCGLKPVDEYRGKRKRVRHVKVIETPFKHAMAPKPQPTPQQPAKFCKCGASLRTGSNLCACDKQPTSGFTHTSLFPALFIEQQPAQSAQQLNLF